MEPRDVEELAQYWTAAQRAVSAFLRAMVQSSHNRDDLLQQVAVVVVRKFSQYDRAQPFTAWAIGIAKQEVLAYRRRRKTDRHIFDDAMVERIALDYQHYLPEGTFKLRDALESCLEKLQGRSRKAIDFHYTHGMKSSQIAPQLGLGDGAVRMLLSRTRDALRVCIEQQLGRSLQEP